MGISNVSSGLRPGVCTSTTRPNTPFEGQLIYETDTDKMFVWNGSTWIENISAEIVNAKGDILAGTADNTVSRLAVGTNNRVLTADSGTSTGLKWGDGPALVLVKSQTVGTSVASVTVSDAFNTNYDDYLIHYSGGTNSNTGELTFQLSGGTGANYNTGIVYYVFNAGGPQAATAANGTSFSWAGYAGTNSISMSVRLFGPYLAKNTYYVSDFWRFDLGIGFASGIHSLSTSYTGFVVGSPGTMTGGTIYVYGYRKS